MLHPESLMQASLAQKVLHGWMQNRHQTLYPLVLNWRNMDGGARRLVLSAMALALHAGEPDEGTLARAQGWLRSIGARDADIAALLDEPPSIGNLAATARAAKQGPQAYAAAVAALGRRGLVNRRFHDFLAARLGLPDEVARSLNRRHGS